MSPNTDIVRSTLEEYGEVTRHALTSYLEAECRREDVYRLAAEYPRRRGRSMRASFCITAARAFGASVSDAVRSAVSLELLHSAFLVHDDIEDESEERRGHPALHRLHGVPSAINAGDALVVMGLRPLLSNRALLGARVSCRVLEEVERMARESVEGQAIELKWRRDNRADIRQDDYLRMILKKTCWYTTIYPCRVGALIGTRDSVDLDRFVRFGFFLGAAFQIQDDLLNLAGDHSAYGKELEGDLREGKRTLMLIHMMSSCSVAERTRLLGVLAQSRDEKSADDIQWIRGLMRERGSLEHARSVAHALAGAALHEFRCSFAGLPQSRDLRFIEALPYWVIERA